jgi:serine/threonine protein kinase
MSYCLNPLCPQPQNTNDGKFCLSCGAKLLLKDRYRAVRPIGQGGFGKTFLALDEDKPSKPYCVIKQFYPQAQGTNTLKKAIELFNQEAVRLDELGEHPLIPDLMAYFTQEDRQYLVQEFINGQNLAQDLRERGVYTEVEVRQLLFDLLPVLQYCYEKQVIHRDIKPENIIRRRSDNKPFLVDFGASKFATYTSLNQTGTSIGSPEYVAPEQIRGWGIFASDIYSLGVTCLNLLTGRSPFDIYDIHNDNWKWQEFLPHPISPELEQILDKMVATAPSRRYKTADEVLKDLNRLFHLSIPPSFKPSSTPTPPPPPTIVNPKKTPSLPNIPNQVSQPKTQIDNELEEIKTMFMTKGKTPNQPSNSAPSTNPNSVNTNSNNTNSTNTNSTNTNFQKDEIDDALEEMKKKYGNTG